ncbi:MAG: glycosyltransferase, partial [Bacteroidota bacterium]
PYPEEKVIDFLAIPYQSHRDAFRAARIIFRYCQKHRPDMVHCHFMGACLSGLPAAFLAGVRLRLHTRHHGGPYPVEDRPRLGWFYDRFNNWLSTNIIATNKLIQSVLLKEGVVAAKIQLIYQGFDFQQIDKVDPQQIEKIKEKYLSGHRGPVIGVVSRYQHLKGVQYIIPAFVRLRKDYPNAILVLASANGPYAPTIKQLLSDLPPEAYVEIPFERDIFSLYRLFDIFVHVPLAPHYEGFGQVYVEAMACQRAMIATRSGIANELTKHRENSWIVDYKNSQQIYEGLKHLLDHQDLRQEIGKNAQRTVHRFGFKVEDMIQSLEQVYYSLLKVSTHE